MTKPTLRQTIHDWCARELFGWTKSEKGFWFKPEKEPSWNYDALDPPSYTTDANDDAEVMRRIVESDEPQFADFPVAVEQLWLSRSDGFGDPLWQRYQTGDYVIAAYAASHNRDPIEVWKELNQ